MLMLPFVRQDLGTCDFSQSAEGVDSEKLPPEENFMRVPKLQIGFPRSRLPSAVPQATRGKQLWAGHPRLHLSDRSRAEVRSNFGEAGM